MNEEVNKIEEEKPKIKEEKEENIFDKLSGLKAEKAQMERMIAENIRLIAEGDDVEGRTFLKEHLETEVLKKAYQIAQIQKQIEEMEL